MLGVCCAATSPCLLTGLLRIKSRGDRWLIRSGQNFRPCCGAMVYGAELTVEEYPGKPFDLVHVRALVKHLLDREDF